MKKTEVISWDAWKAGTYCKPTKLQVVVEHIERNKVIYKVAGVAVVLLLTCDITALADPSHIDAVPAMSSNIDSKAGAFYHDKLLSMGKWAIIIKGGWTTIQKTIGEDFEGAKKSFFSYLLVYLFLLAFPWAMNQMDGLFV